MTDQALLMLVVGMTAGFALAICTITAAVVVWDCLMCFAYFRAGYHAPTDTPALE